MRPLPFDIARCCGRMGLSPRSDTCSERDTCMRYVSFSQLDVIAGFENYRNISVAMAVENCEHKIEVIDDTSDA